MQLWHSAQGHLPAAEAMARGSQGQGDDGVGGAATGDGGVPAGVHVGGYEGSGSIHGERGADDLKSAPADIHAA